MVHLADGHYLVLQTGIFGTIWDNSVWLNQLSMTGLFINHILEVKSQKRWIIELLEHDDTFLYILTT